ncbi:hypothetical protein [Clostridium sp. AM58-1XD]|uniref:hypothetical protein n=1 Tax=Clostridium sp. AM58-1XD TaxID=2292307 RepID=UPI0015F4D129|nr:hypothetical protein [Clostridium sp. AM58-1XD]
MNARRVSDWYHKGTFYNAKNFCVHRYHYTIAYKYSYNGKTADRKYRETLSNSSAGISLAKQQPHQKDQIITLLIIQGQSPYQVITNLLELESSVLKTLSIPA